MVLLVPGRSPIKNAPFPTSVQILFLPPGCFRLVQPWAPAALEKLELLDRPRKCKRPHGSTSQHGSVHVQDVSLPINADTMLIDQVGLSNTCLASASRPASPCRQQGSCLRLPRSPALGERLQILKHGMKLCRASSPRACIPWLGEQEFWGLCKFGPIGRQILQVASHQDVVRDGRTIMGLGQHNQMTKLLSIPVAQQPGISRYGMTELFLSISSSQQHRAKPPSCHGIE